MRSFIASSVLLGLASAAAVPAEPRANHGHKKFNVQVGDRPYYLIENMEESPLKRKLESCSEQDFKPTEFSFAHRGASLQYPEHTYQAYSAARRQGAGVIECDVAFTKDKQLVCRHAQCVDTPLSSRPKHVLTTSPRTCTPPPTFSTPHSPQNALRHSNLHLTALLHRQNAAHLISL